MKSDKAKIAELKGNRLKVYRAIHNLYMKTKECPSQKEIAKVSGVKPNNLNPLVTWLYFNGFIDRSKRHRSIVPQVKLPKNLQVA